MRTWESESWWPFYCATCGIVDVNLCKPLVCSRCGTPEIVPYGVALVSIGQQCRFAYVQAWNYDACEEGHLCPVCRRRDLRFDRGQLDLRSD